MQTVVNANTLQMPLPFQLVRKPVDIPCDEILGRDFLEHAGEQNCYA